MGQYLQSNKTDIMFKQSNKTFNVSFVDNHVLLLSSSSKKYIHRRMA